MNTFARVAGLILLSALPAAAQPSGSITFEEALALARQSAPALVGARMRLAEARARVTEASLPLSSNPEIELETGRRDGDAPADYGVGVEQDLDLPSRRRARIDASRAGMAREESRIEEIERSLLREVATAFVGGLAARERAAVASSGMSLAEEALRIAKRRHAAGDVARLDVNLARTALARASAEKRAAEAELGARTTELQVLLGAADPIAISGSLRELPPMKTAGLAERATDRADVRVLDAEIAEAEAERRIAETLRWPDFGLRASYEREEGDRILTGGIGITLPLFDRGQAEMAIANARASRLRAERAALVRTIEAEVRGALAALELRRTSSSNYAETVMPLIEENEALALESYEVGQIGLAELLLVRRDGLDARLAFIDQLIETRLAEIDLRARAGVRE
ncbi:MAG: TolC family protein [Thermoanaerobaculia bacterium]